MTSANKDTNKDSVKQSVASFKGLSTDEQLATIALIYTKVSGSVPKEAIAKVSSAEVGELVNKVEKLSQQQQLDAVRSLLSTQKSDQDELTLDPNPAKALTELATGGNDVPTASYTSMKTESKLAFWYQLGQRLGSTVIAIPSDYSPSPKVTGLLESISSLEVDQQTDFLTQVV